MTFDKLLKDFPWLLCRCLDLPDEDDTIISVGLDKDGNVDFTIGTKEDDDTRKSLAIYRFLGFEEGKMCHDETWKDSIALNTMDGGVLGMLLDRALSSNDKRLYN